MTHGPDMGGQQHYPPGGYQQPGGPGWGTPPPGPRWTGSPPPPHTPRRSRWAASLIVILISGLVAGGVVTAILLTSRGNDSRSGPAGLPAPTTPTPALSSAPDGSGGDPQSGSQPVPPPTPTGKAYDDDPAVGACVDVARRPTGLVLYQADCADPAASLIVDNIQPDKCQGEGYKSLRGFNRQMLCFTYNVRVGDCVDLDIPRRASCSSTATPSGPKGTVTITEVHREQQDGARCASPDQFLQVGKGEERGIACFTTTSTQSATPTPSR